MPLLEQIQSPGSVGGQVERNGSPSDVDIDAVVAELARHCASIAGLPDVKHAHSIDGMDGQPAPKLPLDNAIDVLSGSKLAA